MSAGHAASKTQDASFIRQDKPVHTAQRRLWLPFFNASHIAALRPRIQEIIDSCIDNLIAAGQPADLVKHVAMAVPSRVICLLLNVPDEDYDFFQTQSAVRQDISNGVEVTRAANQALNDYWHRMVEDRLANPGDDLVSRLIVEQVHTGNITKDEMVAMAQLILFAGHGTTTDMIALGTSVLLENPETMARMKADPSITPRVVEELLRYLTIAHNGLSRLAKEDVEIGGQLIREGEGVILHLGSANRDESVFADPDHFDDSRQARQHVAFGAGIHSCVGAPLARAELQMVFDTLLRRLPDLHLAEPLSSLGFRVTGLFYGVDRVPVAW